jgi:glycerol-3-phosphate acyltransferase PlsY
MDTNIIPDPSFFDIIRAFYVIFALPLGYLIGSIPFGLILTKLFGYGDIRKIGSGNIGATNVLRTGNKKLAALTLLCDSLKGALAVYFLSSPDFAKMQMGAFIVLGHCFPVWLKFKGGKGVATALGVLLAAVPYAGLTACLTWLVTAKITKISSLSALVALAIAPIITLIFYGTYAALICVLITALIFYRHKDNIKRLLNGTEPKIGQKKNDVSPQI